MFLDCFGNTNSSGRHFPVFENAYHRFSLADIRKSTNNFHKKRLIGRGGYGELYKGYLQHIDGASDYAVAVKRFKVKRWEVLKTEIELLCQLRHRNIISVVGFCNHRKEKIIVYQYLSNGSLYQKLVAGKLSWIKRLEICTSVARALNYLHAESQCTIIHRYINPRNILLDDNMQPILAGFELAVQVFPSTPKPMQLKNVEGTIGYIAPEHLKDGTISDKSDVYSFGVILLEVVWGRTIFYMTGSENYLEKPVEEDIDPNIKGNIAPGCWQVVIDIAQRCLKHEPEERPTMHEVDLRLQHALLLQAQADISNPFGDYIIMSNTIINPHENIIKKVETDSYCMPEDVSDLEDTLSG